MEKMNENLLRIAKQFIDRQKINSINTLGEGFINDTYVVISENKYLLQRKNKNIFKNIPGMMDNILKVTSHLKSKIAKAGGDPERETMTLIKTKEDLLYFKDEKGDFWTMCLYIDDHLIFEVADSNELAYAGGKGLGKFQSMLSDFNENLVDTLPGFHNIKFRFKQWDECLNNNFAGKKNSLKEEITWIESRREEMMSFYTLIENGSIQKRITHNDTKLSNFLFDKNKEVLCVIDLDTVLESPVLYDFGDAIRSYTNTGKEDDKDLENVSMDIDLFKAYTEGYLSEAKSFLTQIELDNLAFGVKYIIFEQVLRFLMDYIDGDKYYKIKYSDHNLVRTHAQYKLLLSIEEQYEGIRSFIRNKR